MKKYVVELTSEERSHLDEISKSSSGSAQRRRRASILLAADQGPGGPKMKDADIAKAYRCRVQTVERIRKSLVSEGLESCLRHGNTEAHRERTFDGEAEAHLIALGCSRPPDGRVRWTFRLLADRAVELGIVESCSSTTVYHTLKKTNSGLT